MRAVSAVLAVVACAVWLVGAPTGRADTVPVIVPTVLGTVPHDTGSYSEGLEFDGPALYEATGEVGKSQLRQLDPDTGAVLRSADLPATYWGEGITVVGDRIWQLTYQDGVAIEWDKASFTPLREVPYTGQGWGLCFDGTAFIRTDGTNRLYFHDATTFAQVGTVDVTLDGQQLRGLNEVECVDGQLWAAGWPQDRFVRIDPETGVVNALLDVAGLWQFGERSPRQVVSGIAHISGDEYLISGKEWPRSVRVLIQG